MEALVFDVDADREVIEILKLVVCKTQDFVNWVVEVTADPGRTSPGGLGFREAPPHPFQANAHMHLLEAALAWLETDGGAEWQALAAEIVDLALTRFIDRDTGFVREFFDCHWAPAEGEDGGGSAGEQPPGFATGFADQRHAHWRIFP